MENKKSTNTMDLAGNLPNELVLLAYYQAASENNLLRYGPNGDNPEFFNTLTQILNPNFETIIQYKQKILNKKYMKSESKDILKTPIPSTKYERMLQRLNAQDTTINRLVAIRNSFFKNLAKLTPNKISSFMDGVPVIEQNINVSSSAVLASKDSVVVVSSEKEKLQISLVIYTAQDKWKVDKALQRRTTSKTQPQQLSFDFKNK